MNFKLSPPSHRLYYKLATLIICISLIIAGYLVQFNLLVVRQINCRLSTADLCPESEIAILSALQGQPLLSPLFKELESWYLPKSRGYQLQTESWSLGGVLNITLTPKNPIMSLKTPSGRSWLEIASDGTLIKEVDDPRPGTVKILYAATYQPEKSLPASKLLNSLIDLVFSLSAKGIPVDTITLYHDTVIAAQLPDNKQAVFSASEPISRQVASLQVILTKATMSKETPVIDVRFDKPVLRAALPGQTSVSIHSQ